MILFSFEDGVKAKGGSSKDSDDRELKIEWIPSWYSEPSQRDERRIDARNSKLLADKVSRERVLRAIITSKVLELEGLTTRPDAMQQSPSHANPNPRNYKYSD